MFMGPLFLFILLLVIGGPIAKAIAWRIQKGGEGVPPDLLRRLKEEIDAAELRALDSDKRVGELEERVDFLERLLQAPKSQATLPPPAPAQPPSAPVPPASPSAGV